MEINLTKASIKFKVYRPYHQNNRHNFSISSYNNRGKTKCLTLSLPKEIVHSLRTNV